MSQISENLHTVETNILAACRRSGRDRGEVTLIAVSKICRRGIYDISQHKIFAIDLSFSQRSAFKAAAAAIQRKSLGCII